MCSMYFDSQLAQKILDGIYSRCPVPFYRPEEGGKYYWDSNVGNCQPYFTNGCSSPTTSFEGYFFILAKYDLNLI